MRVAVAGVAQHLGELPLELGARVHRVGHLRFGFFDLLAQVGERALGLHQLALQRGHLVLGLGDLGLEPVDAVLHLLGGLHLPFDRGRRLVAAADLGEDGAGLGDLLHQIAALLAELRELLVLLLDLVVELLLLAGGAVGHVAQALELVVQALDLLLADLDLALHLVFALGEHLDEVVLLLQLARHRVGLGAADGDAVLELLDLSMQRLVLAALVGLDRGLHALALALELGGRVIRFFFVELLLDALELVLALLEQGAELLGVAAGAGGRLVRGLLLHLLHLALELAVLVLEELQLALECRELDLVLRADLGAQAGLGRGLAGRVGDDTLRLGLAAHRHLLDRAARCDARLSADWPRASGRAHGGTARDRLR